MLVFNTWVHLLGLRGACFPQAPEQWEIAGRSEFFSSAEVNLHRQLLGAAVLPALLPESGSGPPAARRSAAQLEIAACVTRPRRGEGGKESWEEIRLQYGATADC